MIGAESFAALAISARMQAARMVLDGRDSPAAQRHIERCTHYHRPTETLLIFTRDAGHHSSGWWKNPDYERCLHLSVSFVGTEGGRVYLLPFDRRMAGKWAEAFFGTAARLCWIEPPYSRAGKVRGVHHYRLFCDPGWQPILPRGEVYSRAHTPAGWLSFSELHRGDD
jgi:hypothetical protein